MRITQEADYALRIGAALAKTSDSVGTPQLSEMLCIPPRSASKILRKMMLSGVVKSIRGVNGGFVLARNADEITLRHLIESVDGRISIRHCLLDEHNCSYQKDKSKCRFHMLFEQLNNEITSRLERFTLADMVDTQISVDELIKRLK